MGQSKQQFWQHGHSCILLIVLFYGCWSAIAAQGQTNFPDAFSGRNTIPTPNQETLPLPRPSEAPPVRLEPISPADETPSSSPTSDTETFRVQEVEVIGNTIFEVEIQALVDPFQNRQATLDDLFDLRTQITQLYQSAGYLSSGAFLPKQAFTDGIIRIQVVESQMEAVEIHGLKRLKDSYVRDRLQFALKPPLNQPKLEQALQQLQQNPLLGQVDAKLSAGSGPGLNRLVLTLREAKSKSLALQVDNHQASAIGEIGGTLDLKERNLTGRGDRIRFSYTRTEGLNQYDASYQIPFNAKDGTAEFRFRKNDTSIITNNFRELEIRSNTDTFSLELRQPVLRHPNQELALGAKFEVRNNQTFIDDSSPFSFDENAIEGRSRVRPIRLYADWYRSQANSIVALRSQLSLGLDWLGSTNEFEGASGEFFSWLGQAQWLKRLSGQILLLSTFNFQLTPNELLSLEKYSLGGRNSVRGYIQNYRLGDNGVNGTLEVRIPVDVSLGTLTLSPFFDAGAVWNQSSPTPDDSVLASLGLDISWQPIDSLSVQVGYGIPLLNDSLSRGAIQDSGVTFLVRAEQKF